MFSFPNETQGIQNYKSIIVDSVITSSQCVQDILHRCNSASATYLFQTDKFYDTRYDTGDKSVQCGRKVDAFKLWLMWKARGDRGLEEMVDYAFECAK